MTTQQSRSSGGSFPAQLRCGAEDPEISLCEEKTKGNPMPYDRPVTAAELGEFLGLSSRAIRSLADEGHVVRAPEKARYRLAESVRTYCAHIREIAAGRGGASGVSTLTAERARLAREQADAAAIKNAAARGEMIPASKAAAEWRGILTGVRARVLAIPSRVRLALPHLTLAEVEIVEREVRDALTESANG